MRGFAFLKGFYFDLFFAAKEFVEEFHFKP